MPPSKAVCKDCGAHIYMVTMGIDGAQQGIVGPRVSIIWQVKENWWTTQEGYCEHVCPQGATATAPTAPGGHPRE